MPSKKPRLATYTTQDTVDKFNFIAAYEKRSTSKELEYIVSKYIEQFESEHGELLFDENSNISLSNKFKPTVQSSSSKTG
ncbi:MAG: hypothetical protein QXI16_03495 [Sulfolobaceae archaeon]